VQDRHERVVGGLKHRQPRSATGARRKNSPGAAAKPGTHLDGGDVDSQADDDHGLERAGPRRGLVLALAASAGAHAALVPGHAAEGLPISVLFAVSALVLAGFSVLVDRSDRRAVVVAAALLLGGLLTLYAASRVVVVWPLAHVEPIDAVGAITKLVEAAGLTLALSLLWVPSGSIETLRAVREGDGR
jgi:hypothetical protein